MKRTSLEDASDRAAKYLKSGTFRMPLSQIGFHPDNRGGMGISPYHVHEVAADCQSNGLKQRRYSHVEVVKIPEDLLPDVRDANRRMCEANPLLPAFAPGMTHVVVVHTHFTFACKLDKDGGRFLFNEGKDRNMGLFLRRVV